MSEISQGTYVLKRHTAKKKAFTPKNTIASLKRENQVKYLEQEFYRLRVSRNTSLTFNDPKWKDMWYLNDKENLPSHGVYGSWSNGFTGKGVLIAVVDDGMEINHPDLQSNLDKEFGFDFLNGNNNPSHDIGRSHGTKCAGILGAVANNSYCLIGVAYDAKFTALKMIDHFGSLPSAEAGALRHRSDEIDIYSCSWGVVDGYGFHGPEQLVRNAFEEGIKYGRRGKGSIFVWAAGNGGLQIDDCNCDGYVNSIYTIAISGVAKTMLPAYYAEQCSTIMACTYSSNEQHYNISTTDINGRCGTFTGTSANTPLAAGIIALTLEANQDLTWRDIQHLIANTSITNGLRGGSLTRNGAGKILHSYCGFGLLDADKMTQTAKTWTGVPSFKHCQVTFRVVNLIFDNSYTAEDNVVTDGCNSTNNFVAYVEHVQVHITFTAAAHKEVSIDLISPSGTVSRLLHRRPYDNGQGQQSWTFTSLYFWGEVSHGKWGLKMKTEFDSRGGTLISWQLKLFGTSTYPSIVQDINEDDNQNNTGIDSLRKSTSQRSSILNVVYSVGGAAVGILVACGFVMAYKRLRNYSVSPQTDNKKEDNEDGNKDQSSQKE